MIIIKDQKQFRKLMKKVHNQIKKMAMPNKKLRTETIVTSAKMEEIFFAVIIVLDHII